MPTITGTGEADYLVGPGANDTIMGGAGNDTIVAGGPGATLTGGPGDDTFVFAPGYTSGATITDWTGSDHVVFTSLPANYRITAVVTFDGTLASVRADAAAKLAAGFQIVLEAYGPNGSNVAVFVDSQNNRTIGDTLVFQGSDLSRFAYGVFIGGGGGGGQLIGDGGSNTLVAGSGNDTLNGKAGNDSLVGGAGENALFGEGGDDTLTGAQGNDVLDGGDGVDTVRFANAGSGVTVNLNTTTAQLVSAGEGRDAIRNVENVEGSSFNDLIIGASGANLLVGGAGDDTLVAGGLGGAPDTLSGGSGSDVFDLGSVGHAPAAGALGGRLERLDRITDWSSNDVLRLPDVAATASNYVEFNAASYDDAYVRAMAAAQGGAVYIAAQVGSDVVVFAPRYAEAVVLAGARLSDISADNIRGTAAAPSPPAPAQHATIPPEGFDITGAFVVGATERIILTEGSQGGIHTNLYLDPRQGQADPTFRNQGTIELTGAGTNSPTLLYVGTASFWNNNVIENNGRMYVAASDSIPFYSGYARGIWATSWSPDVLNSGSIEVHGGEFAVGIESWDAAFNASKWTFTNTETGKLIVGAKEQASGVYAANGGLIVNHGLIYVAAFNNDDYTGAFGLSFPNGRGEVHNYGTIVANSPNPDVYTSAIGLGGYDRNLVVNYGTITAKFAIASGTDRNNGPPYTYDDRVENYGTLNGQVSLNQGPDTFINAGVVNGAVDLGSENDTYDGRFGAVSGMVSAGSGDDVLMGGFGFDNFQGNAGNDTETGGAGDDWVVGGKDNDLLSGGVGNDLVYGNLGNDTCDGGDGADVVRGGQGDDTVSAGAGADFVSGDLGNDTLSGGAGGDIFNTFAETGIDRVLDFNVGEGDRVQLAPGTQYTLAQVGADTVINMTGGGQMILVGVQMGSLTPGWIFGA